MAGLFVVVALELLATLDDHLEQEVARARHHMGSRPVPRFGDAFMLHAVDLRLGAQRLALTLLLGSGLAESNAGETVSFRAVDAG